jgi:hypothetical protein
MPQRAWCEVCQHLSVEENKFTKERICYSKNCGVNKLLQNLGDFSQINSTPSTGAIESLFFFLYNALEHKTEKEWDNKQLQLLLIDAVKEHHFSKEILKYVFNYANNIVSNLQESFYSMQVIRTLSRRLLGSQEINSYQKELDIELPE